MAMYVIRIYARGTILIVLGGSQPDRWEQRVKELVYGLAPIFIGEGLKALF